MRPALFAGLIGGFLLLIAAPASAAVTASVSNTGVLVVTGDAGPNNVQVTVSGADLAVGGADTAGAGCTNVGGVKCASASIASINAALGDFVDVWDSETITLPTTVDLGNGFDLAGPQRARTGAGVDTILGGPEKESDIDAGAGNDTIKLFGGNDGVELGPFNPFGSVLGGPGNDIIEMGDGNDGGPGIAFIDGGAGDDIIDLGAGNDRSVIEQDVSSGQDIVRGGPGDDGAPGGPSFNLGNGNDEFDGGPGNDFGVDGGAGTDTIRGGADNDTLNTELDGEKDTIEGGAGDDAFTLVYGGGFGETDALSGGPGRDSVSPTSNSPAVTISANGVADDGFNDGPRTVDIGQDIEVLIGSANDDTLGAGGTGAYDLRGGKGADQLIGGTGPDALNGGEGGDTLDGGGADDVLNGAQGDDALAGGDGNDYLTGSTGADTIRGNAGRDTADWSLASGPVTLTPGGTADDGEAGEGDLLADDVENQIGSGFNDTMTGAPGASLLSGGGGDDTLTVTDGAPDIVVCGSGDDGVKADAGDAIELTGTERCERVDQPAPAVIAPLPTAVPTPAPTTLTLDPLPTLKLKGKATKSGRQTLNIACPAAAATACKGDIRLLDKAGEPISRKAPFNVAPGKNADVRVTLNSAARSTLRKKKKLAAQVLAEVTGALDTFRRAVKAVTLKR